MKIDFSPYQNVRKPTKKELSNYRNWVKYLSDSKLTSEEVHKRAASFASRGSKCPPKSER